MKLIDVGFGNYVSAERIVTVASTDSLPVRRLVQDAKNDGRVIDVSCGKKTRACKRNISRTEKGRKLQRTGASSAE